MVGSYDDWTGRWDCDCGREFPHESALRQHLINSSQHSYCDRCDRDFPSWNARRQHWIKSSAHSFCVQCNEDFDDGYDLADHYKTQHYFCYPCNMVFWTIDTLESHETELHFYCKPCRRYFQSANNLNAHMNSATHKPRDVPCPWRECSAAFVSKAALVAHWEAGTCPGGITRAFIDNYIRKNDVRGLITNRGLITGGSSAPPPTFIASERSWNGHAYECYLCHAKFAYLPQLNQHLNSPKHSGPGRDAYRCPGSSCSRQFSTLSGLVQHIENGACGVAKFKEVQDAMDQLLNGVKRLTMS